MTPPPGPFSNPLAGLPQYANKSFQECFRPPKMLRSLCRFQRRPSTSPPAVTKRFRRFTTGISTIEHQLEVSGWRAWLTSAPTPAISSSETDLNPAVYIPGSALSTDARRLFHNYSDILLNDQSGNANYNSLQLTLQKRFAHGVSVLANYTYQKSIDDSAARRRKRCVGGRRRQQLSSAVLPQWRPATRLWPLGVRSRARLRPLLCLGHTQPRPR